MLSLGRRIRRLEQSELFQRKANALGMRESLALRQLSDEELSLLITVTRDREAGVCRIWSQSEAAAVAASQAALERVSRREAA